MATEPLNTVKNAAAKLDPSMAFFLPNGEAQSVPLSNAKEVRIAWSFSTNDNFAELEQFLTLYTWPTNTDAERRYVVDPNVGGTPLPGTWRQSFITRIERRGEDRQDEMVIVLTLRRGWAEAIDWTEALLVSRKDADGNGVSVTGISDTDSYNDASAVVVRFPNISPYKIRQCMAEFADSIYTDVKVQGDTIAGAWHKAFVSGRVVEDGSGVVELVLSRERFTVKLYQNYGTITQASVYKLYDVTRDIAQQIVTSWQGEGRSADISLSTESELCVVTLTDRDAAKDNLSTDWIKDACDRFIRYHFAWGYTKAELDAWIKTHDGLLNSPAVPGDEGADTQPITRRLSVRERGDGLFNAEIEERKFDNSDPTVPDFVISLPIGTTTTRVQEYGWNFKHSEVDADAIRDRYDETAKAIGKTVQFDLTRDDDCSFDFRAVITSVASTSADLTASGTGITSKVVTGRHLDGMGEKAAVEALVATGPRKRVSLDLSIGEDDSKQYKARIEEVVETEGTPLTTTGAGIQLAVTAHKNRDVGDVADLGSSGIRERVSASIGQNDDGTQDITIQKQTLVETAGTELSTSGTGIQVTSISHKNRDPGDITTLGATAIRERISASVSPNDDGSIDAVVQKQTLVETNDYTKATTGAGIQVAVVAHKNVDPADITTLGTAAIRERVSASLSPNDDGSVDATIQKQTLVETAGTELSTSGTGIQVSAILHKNRDPGDITTLGATAIRERLSASLSPNDDGSVDATIQKQTVVETNGYTKATTGLGIQTSITAHKNVDPADITTLGAVGVRERLSASLSPNDDGSVDAVVQKQTVVETNSTHATTGTGTEGAYADVGVFTKLFFGNNADLGDLPAVLSAYRKRHTISVQAADDGSVAYAITEQQIAEIEDSFDISPVVTLGVGRKIFVGTRVSIEDFDTTISGLAPSATVEYDLSVQGNEDGTVDYAIREITKQAPTGAYNVGTALKSVLINVARNQIELEDPTTPTERGVSKQLQPLLGDDGSITYELRTITAAGDLLAATTKGGTLLSAVTQKHVSDGVTVADLDASAAVAEGTAIQWQLVINEDGSFNYVKTTAESDDLVTAGLAAVNLLPSLDRYGYKDSTIHFENIKAAALATYFIYTGTTYGQVEQFRINADGTYSGRASTRTYRGGGGGGWGGVGVPDDVEYYLWDIIWDTRSDMSGYWIVQYAVQEQWDTDYEEAAEFILNGLQPTFTNKQVIEGTEIWHSRRTLSIAISARLDADSGAVAGTVELPGDFVAEMTILAPIVDPTPVEE